MGKYTALDDPRVDRLVEEHMQQIVAAVRERTDPQAILLRGSFGRGEGSVVVEGDHMHFLSDYELMAVTPDYADREWLETVAHEMTTRLGVETSIARLHPSTLGYRGSCMTIAMYELQAGGLILYGDDILHPRVHLEACGLTLWSGLRLLLNRMAESLDRVSPLGADWEGLRWINKTVLSCAEAILTARGQYHFSYAERGRRFATLTDLQAVTARAPDLPGLVRRATAFKLCPSLDLYAEPLPALEQRVRRAVDATLRYVVRQYLGIEFASYAEYPERYLAAMREHNHLGKSKFKPLPAPLSQNLYLALRLLRDRRLPPPGLLTGWTYPAHQVVYSIVPLAFLGGDRATLREMRRQLSKIVRLRAERPDDQAEWQYLRTQTRQAWKDLCYGLWEIV